MKNVYNMDKEQKVKAMKLKQYADFSQTQFYQQVLKPYLREMMEQELEILNVEPQKEFDCIKRDIALYSIKKTINNITRKIDSASEKLNKLIKKGIK